MEEKIKAEVSAFLKKYEEATNSHKFNNVRPLISPEAVYFFSNENLFGIAEIEKAFTDTFNTIKDEIYSINDIQWLAISDVVAVCVYNFHWVGTIGGKRTKGSGRGTNALVRSGDNWLMVHEHLSKPRG